MCGAVFTSDGNFNVNVAGTTGGGCTEDYLSFGTDKKCGTDTGGQDTIRLGKTFLSYLLTINVSDSLIVGV